MIWRTLARARALSVVILLLVTAPAWAQAQQKTIAPMSFGFDESGFLTGFGTGGTSSGDYNPILLVWHLASDMKKYITPLRDHKGTLSFILEPQVNPAFRPNTDIEFGIGVGLKYAFPLTERISPYIMGSLGPQLITIQTESQASGFNFAEVAGGGVYYYLDGKSAINLGYRFRHLSNAGFKVPNGGLNTHFGVIGYSVFF